MKDYWVSFMSTSNKDFGDPSLLGLRSKYFESACVVNADSHNSAVEKALIVYAEKYHHTDYSDVIVGVLSDNMSKKYDYFFNSEYKRGQLLEKRDACYIFFQIMSNVDFVISG